jgi:hypothetical protein
MYSLALIHFVSLAFGERHARVAKWDWWHLAKIFVRRTQTIDFTNIGQRPSRLSEKPRVTGLRLDLALAQLGVTAVGQWNPTSLPGRTANTLRWLLTPFKGFQRIFDYR